MLHLCLLSYTHVLHISMYYTCMAWKTSQGPEPTKLSQTPRWCIYQTSSYFFHFCSSPHLVEVRERLRINGIPISREKFTEYFWDVFGKLEKTKVQNRFNILTIVILFFSHVLSCLLQLRILFNDIFVNKKVECVRLLLLSLLMAKYISHDIFSLYINIYEESLTLSAPWST